MRWRFLWHVALMMCSTFCSTHPTMAQNPFRCGTDEYHQEYLAHDASAMEEWNKLRTLIRTPSAGNLRGPLEIPVVFHIVYRTEEQNISDAAILDQVDIINAALQTSNRENNGIPAHFKPFAAAMGIRLCLSEVLPGGRSKLRITRHQTQLRDIGKNKRQRIKYDSLGGANAWDPEKYLNIWIGEIGNNLLGYSTFPDVAGKPEDGIVLEVRYLLKSEGPYSMSRTLIHEMGHYLGLCHLPGCFKASCEVDDNIEDTPNQGHYYNQELCPETPQISCNSLDMYMNYMAFSPDRCLLMFTQDQVNASRFLLHVKRPGLLGAACNELGTNQSWRQHLHCHYSMKEKSIIISSEIVAPEGWKVQLLSITGQIIQQGDISHRKRYKFSYPLTSGHYIVYFYGPNSTFYKKITVY